MMATLKNITGAAVLTVILSMTSLQLFSVTGMVNNNQVDCIIETGTNDIIQADGLAVLKESSYTVTIFDGRAGIFTPNGSLSVSALTTPVLVEDKNRFIVVPIGHFWRSDNAQIMPITVNVRKRLESSKAVHVPQPTDVSNDVCSLARVVATSPMIQPNEVRPLLTSPALHLLLSFHPKTQLLAWQKPLAMTTEMVRTKTFLKADTQPEALPEYLYELWKNRLEDLLFHPDNIVNDNDWIKEIKQGNNNLHDLGYVMRTQRLQTHASVVFPGVEWSVQQPKENIVPDVKTETVQPVVKLEPYLVQQEGSKIANYLGIISSSSSTAEVKNNTYVLQKALCPKGSALTECGLHINVHTNSINTITLDGVLHPYSVSPQQMKTWLQTK